MQETRFSAGLARTTARAGAIGWLVLAIGWQTSNALEQTMDWDGPPRAAFIVGVVGLLVGGLSLAVLALNPSGADRRPMARMVGLGLVALGLVFSIIAGWAVPIWAAAYGVGMLTLVFSGTLGRSASIIGTSLLVSPVVLVILSELQLGTADSYGDYPVAWAAATWIAAFGSAMGLFIWSRSFEVLDTERAPAITI